MVEEEKPKCHFCGSQEDVKALLSDNNEFQFLICSKCFPVKIAKILKPEIPIESIKKLDDFYVKEIKEWENKFKTKEGLKGSKRGFE